VPGGSGADANDDGVINQADYDLWRGTFGRSTANPGIRTDAAVPYWDVPSLDAIDFVTYMPQTTDQSQGRSPDGVTAFRYFTPPTPGAANPSAASSAALDSFFGELGIEILNRVRPASRPIFVAPANDDQLLLTLIGNVEGAATTFGVATATEATDQSPNDLMDAALAAYLPQMADLTSSVKS
jgi:hypothetical protein